MTTKLQSRRDELAYKTFLTKYAIDEHQVWLDGFDAAVAELWPVIQRLRKALDDAEFIFEGSVAHEGQSDELLNRREEAIMRFLEARAALKKLEDL